jgi:glycosyltransferase involved in cell wall biosynthesis
LFSRDVARIYPEFNHVICFFYDSREDYNMANEFRMDGIDVSHIDRLTEEVVREIDPAIMMFHNTGGKTVDGVWPYDWLKQWPLIAVHHNRTHPCFHADLDVFVSESILKHYEKLKHRMNWKLVPPCMDLSAYEAIERKNDNDRCVIGKLTSGMHTRFPEELLTILAEVKEKTPDSKFSLVGGAEYWKNISLKDCETPKIGSKTPEEFYKGFDIFVHRNKESTMDSWGRVISEAMAAGLPVVCENKGGPAEQITHEVDGFLCNNDEEFVNYIVALANDPQMRYDIGMKARNKALTEFGIERFRKETLDVVMKAALGVL